MIRTAIRRIALAAGVALALAAGCGSDRDPGPGPRSAQPATRGRELAESVGCTSCHSTRSDRRQGPPWGGLAGSDVTLSDGSTVVADASYLAQSITDPDAQVVDGYPPIMPTLSLSDDEVDDLVAYIQELDP